MKPKANPATQARVDGDNSAARAKRKADAAELTLARFHAQATALGVKSIRFELEPDGIVVVLRGVIDGRNVNVEVLAPHGQPFVLYAVSALASFERGMSVHKVPAAPPNTGAFGLDTTPSPSRVDELRAMAKPPTTEHGWPIDEVIVGDETPPTPAERSDADEIPIRRVEREPVDADMVGGLASEDNPDPGNVSRGRAALDEIEAGIEERAKTAAEIAKRSAYSQHGDIRKPAPAGAGKRKPLTLPLCKQCKAQPIYQPKAEFCGSACARAWHIAHAGRVAKASR